MAGRAVCWWLASAAAAGWRVPGGGPLSGPLWRGGQCRGSALAAAQLPCTGRRQWRRRAASTAAGPGVGRPFYNFEHLCADPEATRLNAERRNVGPIDAPRLVAARQRFLDTGRGLNELRKERNRLSKQIGHTPKSERGAMIAETTALKERIREHEHLLVECEAEMMALAARVPNDTHPKAPVGDESQAVVVGVHGCKPDVGDSPLHHVDIGRALDILDFQAGADVSGSKFVFLKNAAALLELGLVQCAIDRAVAKGFVPVMTPDVVRHHVAEGCGFQPRTEEGSQIFMLADEHSDGLGPLSLAGTAEIPLAGMLSNTTRPEEELPLRFVGFGHAFRPEVGGSSSAKRGLYRLHQFSKVELFALTSSEPGASEAMLQELLDFQVSLLTDLGLHFRVLDMPTHELGAAAYRKFDIEAWMPARQGFGEVSSTSSCTDFQSRRLNIRYKPDPAAPSRFAHTLNGTACAVPRIILALLECGQQPDGTVALPPVLAPYLRGCTRIAADGSLAA